METYRYSFFAKIIYRYGNIIATLLLSVHLITLVYLTLEKWYNVFFLIINLVIIFLINSYFIRTYKEFPFEISADNDKLICNNFFLSRKSIEIKIEDIRSIDGGIFSGYPTRPIYLYDGKQNLRIGFYSHVGNFNKLLTHILKNVPQYVYVEVVEKMKRKK